MADIPVYQMLLGLVVTFLSVFLKGFQHKNIEGNHMKLIFFTSYLMAIADIFTVGLIVKNGMWMILPSGTGAAFGMIASIRLHRKLIKKDKQ